MGTKHTGTVRSWRGTWGFIERDDNGTGLFCHQTDICMSGYRELTVGQRVAFDIGESERGAKATHVEIVS
jgi:CspA family cold shock protein